ncbi:PEP/pyruvate-binding domain-containing protein [Nocardia jinanensis]|uniref:Pyruvate, phosphate dikinase n=1 Tax=Nocardia jinanensis TaxID=382504 RepID=A0A917RLH9_9NOCA|nr:PEP/pyruvate-binding domain-containing protein [Nocardia jinanensis]GGL12210.1 pyruvate, phosphate dikinase [Nocardia jinanensis]
MNSVAIEQNPYTLELADPTATLERAGGKGSSLARMAEAGLPVPPGFHVTTAAYRRFVATGGLHDRIVAAAAGAVPDRPETWDSAAAEIAEAIAGEQVPDEIAESIRAALGALGDVAVAVRSSATAEDLPDMSFAGQQETYLDIRGTDAVLLAVKRCWASLWTGRAIGYRARNGIGSGEIALAVVVQELVPAEAAGIAFTADPVTGTRDRVLINAAWGLGEAIVGGQVTPDTFVVAKADGTVLQQDIGDKQVMTVRSPDGTREERVPADRRDRPALSPAQASELARVAVGIEQLYGQPMDIEWALHDRRLFIVQARPITALPDPALADPAWTMPDPHGRYVRGSVMELLPEPLSPLFATLGLPAWDRATRDHYRRIRLPYFDEPFAVVNGYGYYNVDYSGSLLLRMMLAQPRFLTTTLPRYLHSAPQRWSESRDRYRETSRTWRELDSADLSADRILAGVREIVDEAAAYYLTIQGGALPAAYTSESMFTKAYNSIRRGDDPSATTFLLGFDSKPIRAEQSLFDLAAWVRTIPGLAERITCLSSEERTRFGAAPGTGEPADSAWREFGARFRAHLSEFGDMVYDLDFAKPLPADDPAAQLRTLEYFLGDDARDPHQRRDAARQSRDEAVRVLEQKRPGLRRTLALRLLAWAQSAAPLRENALADVGAGWPAVRQLLAELGRRLAATGAIATADDVYWLELDELATAASALDTVQAPPDSCLRVAERRARWRAQRALVVPHTLPVGGGKKILGIRIADDPDHHSGPTVEGTPGSPGRITGPARIIRGPEEFDRMRPGDVLVARMTTPAWTPLFALASAIVTDIGGALSHSSIVAREYHIPAVLGTGAATEKLRTGQYVTVDGDAGVVTVHEERTGSENAQ